MLSNLLFSFFLGVSMAQAIDTSNLVKDIQQNLKTEPDRVFKTIESQGEAASVCDLYDQLVRDLYWADKGPKNLIPVGFRGIEFCLSKAKEIEGTNKALAEDFKSKAKTISFDIAANSWPGWGDAGVTVLKPEMEKGLEAAKLNLSLALELNKPLDKIATAHWLKAALELSLQDYNFALNSIEQSLEYSRKANDLTPIAFGTGFKGLIYLAKGDQDQGNRFFGEGIQMLKDIGDDSAKGYLAQLETAKSIFLGRN